MKSEKACISNLTLIKTRSKPPYRQARINVRISQPPRYHGHPKSLLLQIDIGEKSYITQWMTKKKSVNIGSPIST